MSIARNPAAGIPDGIDAGGRMPMAASPRAMRRASRRTASSASYATRLPVNGLRKTQVYTFAQDEWRFRPKLTFNLGVRYSFYNRFNEVLGRAVPFDLRPAARAASAVRAQSSPSQTSQSTTRSSATP
jgi:outer membrane receptor protein involved in Fe transport